MPGCRLLAVLAFFAIAGCASTGTAPGQASEGPTVHVAGHGMHTGIIVRAADLPPRAWPAQRDFPRAEYLELGWGDREYYQAEDFSVWLGLRALLWPTESAVHVVGFRGPAERAFPGSEIVPAIERTRRNRPGARFNAELNEVGGRVDVRNGSFFAPVEAKKTWMRLFDSGVAASSPKPAASIVFVRLPRASYSKRLTTLPVCVVPSGRTS